MMILKPGKWLLLSRVSSISKYRLVVQALPVLALLLVPVALYWNTQNHQFVYDDDYEILQNPWIRDTSYLPRILFSHSMGWTDTANEYQTNQYAPGKNLLRLIQYSWFGNNPRGYHATNIFIHALCTLFVFLLAQQIYQVNIHGAERYWVAYAAALFYSAHPALTEPVNWASGVSEIAMTMFALIAFYIFSTRWYDSKSGKMTSALAYAISVLFKITGLLLPVCILAYDYIAKKGLFNTQHRGRSRFMHSLARYAPFMLVGLLYMALRWYAVGGIVPHKGYTELTSWQLVLSALDLFRNYIQLFLWPQDLRVFYTFHAVQNVTDPRVLFGVSVAIVFIIALLYSFRKSGILFFGLSWGAVFLLPCLYIPAFIFTNGYVFAERYLYLPSVGFSIGLIAVANMVQRRRLFGRRSVVLVALCLALWIGANSAKTLGRNPVWRYNLSLWEDAVAKAPDSPVAHNNLAVEYSRIGALSQAIEHYERALKLDPTYTAAHANLKDTRRRLRRMYSRP